jgi:hypothetical protein
MQLQLPMPFLQAETSFQQVPARPHLQGFCEVVHAAHAQGELLLLLVALCCV